MIANCRSKWLAGVWEPTIPHGGLLNIKTGFKGVCRVVELSTPLVLQWFAGLFGNAEIGLVLTKKNDKKLCWNHITCLCFYELLGRTLQRGAPRDAGGRCEGSSLLRVQSSVVARTGDAAASTDCSTGRPRRWRQRRGVIEAGEQCLEECPKSFSYLLFACPKSASTFVLLSLASKSVFCNTLKLCSLCLQSGAWES